MTTPAEKRTELPELPELYKAIESVEFQVRTVFSVGGIEALLERFRASPEITALRQWCQNQTVWDDVLGKVSHLVSVKPETAPDGTPYRHTHDVAVAVYGWVLWVTQSHRGVEIRRVLSKMPNPRYVAWVRNLIPAEHKLQWLRAGTGRWTSTCGRYTVWRQAVIRHGGTEWAAQYEDEPWLIEHAVSVTEAKRVALDHHVMTFAPATHTPNARAVRKPRPDAERRRAADAMGEVTQAAAKTEEWAYTAHITPELITDDNDEWNIRIQGVSESGRTRGEHFDLATVKAYHALFGEVIRKFEAGEIRNPWEPQGEHDV